MPSVLQKQLVTVPLAGGIDAKSDPLVVQTSSMLQVSNGVFTDVGGVRKRPGNSAASSVLSAADPATVFSIGPLIGAASARQTSVLTDAGGWTNVGTAETGTLTSKPVVVASQAIFAGLTTTRSDVVQGASSTAYVYISNQAGGGQVQLVGSLGQPIATILGDYIVSYGAGTFVLFPLAGGSVSEMNATTGALTVTVAITGAPQDAVCCDGTNIILVALSGGNSVVTRYSPSTHVFSGGTVSLGVFGGTMVQISPDSTGTMVGILRNNGAAAAAVQFVRVTGSLALNVASSTSIAASQGATLVADSAALTWWVYGVHQTTTALTLQYQKVALTGSFTYTVTSTIQWTRTLASYTASTPAANHYQSYIALRAAWLSGKTQVWLAILGGDISKYVRFSSDNRVTGSLFPGQAAPSITVPGLRSVQTFPTQTSSVGLLPTTGTVGPISTGAYPVLYAITENTAPTAPPSVVSDTRAVLTGGALPQVFSGQEAHEQGFVVGPPTPYVYSVSVGGGTRLTLLQTYTYYFVYEYTNSVGQLERSAASFGGSITLNAANNTTGFDIPLPITNRAGAYTTVYRTAVINGLMSTQAYALTSVSTAQAYLDSTPDATITVNRPLYAQAELPEDAPPPLTKLVRWQNRVLGIDASNPTQLWFAKPYEPGIGPAWNADSTIQFPIHQGDIVGMADMDDKLVVFQADAVSYLTGLGPDAAGNGGFSGPYLLVGSTGCSNAQSILKVDDGVWYQDGRGLCFIDRGLNSSYLGAAVESLFTTDTITNCAQIAEYSQYHWYLGLTTVVYDTVAKRWSTFTYTDTVSAMTYNKLLYRYTTAGLLVKDDTSFLDQGSPYQMTLQTAWIKPLGGPQGYQRVYRAGLLGRWFAPHGMALAVEYDYITGGTGVNWDPTPDPTLAGPPIGPTGNYQVRWQLPRQKCESLRFTFTTSNTYTYFDDNLGHDVTINVADACALSSLVLEFGVLPGITRLPSAQSV